MVDHELDEEAIFKVAREIASMEAIAVYLQQACGNNLALRDRVEALLRVDIEQPEFLEAPVACIDADDPPEAVLSREAEAIFQTSVSSNK
jgi:hypothetical protein